MVLSIDPQVAWQLLARLLLLGGVLNLLLDQNRTASEEPLNHSIRARCVQQSKQARQNLSQLRPLLWMVNRLESPGGNPGLDLLKRVGRVHQQLDGRRSGGQGHWFYATD